MPKKTSLLINALLLSLSFNSAHALDFGSVLKDAVKDQINLPTDDASNATQASTSNASTSTTPNINWKSPSQQEEIAIGQQVTGSILGAAPLVNDASLQQYVNKVGRWVASQSERADLPWKFGVIDSNDINAFAAPGGYVLVTKGLYQSLQNEAQLAGVLGHEIAHVVKKHQLKVMQKQAILDMGTSWLKDKISKNKITQKAVGTTAEISARNLDKDAEFEADRMGMVLATRAGYSAYGLAEVLQNMGQVNQNDNSVSLLFKTHPHPDERMAQLSSVSGDQLDKLPEGKTLESRFYKLK